jgi:hypothetical protein
MNPVNFKMKTATGEISSFLGQIAVELKLGKNLIKHKVLIANISIEGILGMDFLNLVTGSTRPVIPLTIGSIALPATMVSLDGGRTIFSYISILQQVALPLFLYLKQGISLPLYLIQLLLNRTLEPIEIDMIEECHNINAVNCNVQRETIQWPEHIKTILIII